MIRVDSIFSGLDRAKATALLDLKFGRTEAETTARDALTSFFLEPTEENRRAAIAKLDRLPADRQLALRRSAWR